MIRTLITTLAGIVAIVVATASPLSAQTWDDRVYLTFTSPVAVPGATLAPGDYVFRLPDPNSNRKVIQVLSADMKKVHAMFFVNEILRGQEAADYEASLGEAPAGTPRAVEGLWAPGSVYGRGFLYGAEASRERGGRPSGTNAN